MVIRPLSPVWRWPLLRATSDMWAAGREGAGDSEEALGQPWVGPGSDGRSHKVGPRAPAPVTDDTLRRQQALGLGTWGTQKIETGARYRERACSDRVGEPRSGEAAAGDPSASDPLRAVPCAGRVCGRQAGASAPGPMVPGGFRRQRGAQGWQEVGARPGAPDGHAGPTCLMDESGGPGPRVPLWGWVTETFTKCSTFLF